jgi:hypothetical protein
MSKYRVEERVYGNGNKMFVVQCKSDDVHPLYNEYTWTDVRGHVYDNQPRAVTQCMALEGMYQSERVVERTVVYGG